jgi:hypothetical protein
MPNKARYPFVPCGRGPSPLSLHPRPDWLGQWLAKVESVQCTADSLNWERVLFPELTEARDVTSARLTFVYSLITPERSSRCAIGVKLALPTMRSESSGHRGITPNPIPALFSSSLGDRSGRQSESDYSLQTGYMKRCFDYISARWRFDQNA